MTAIRMVVWFVKADYGGVLPPDGEPATALPAALLERFRSWAAEYPHLQHVGPALQEHAKIGEALARRLKHKRPNDTIIYFNIALAIADYFDDYPGQRVSYIYEITSQSGKS